MSGYRTGLDIINTALDVAGELVDGSSGYQETILTYLNRVYRSLIAGGNVFGTDVADPWVWAMAKRPILLTMVPAISNVAVSVTQLSNNIVLSTAPLDVAGNQISVQGWFLTITGRDEWFQIVNHVAGNLTAQIDMPYTELTSAASSARLTKLDYDLIDDSILIDQYNQYVDFSEGTSTLTAQLPVGIYTPQAFATAVAQGMTSAGTRTYSGSFSEVTRLFTWTAPSAFSILSVTGPNSPYNASEVMGLDMLDLTAQSSYTSVYPLNAISRLTAPMLMYRRSNQPWRDSRNEGKIFNISYNTFTREYPFTMLCNGMPDRFAVVKTSETGIVTVRLNGYFDAYAGQLPSRIEVPYIPKKRDLQFNTSSIPVVPEEHRTFLADAAASLLMQDKSDSKSQERQQMAMSGLQALQSYNRKDNSLAGINYGKLIPRAEQTYRRWWWVIT